jgi:hypothetical protein
MIQPAVFCFFFAGFIHHIAALGNQLLMDVQDLGNEFALTLENEKSAVLSMQLANLQIIELQRRAKLSEDEIIQRRKEEDEAIRREERELAGIDSTLAREARTSFSNINLEPSNDIEVYQNVNISYKLSTH